MCATFASIAACRYSTSAHSAGIGTTERVFGTRTDWGRSSSCHGPMAFDSSFVELHVDSNFGSTTCNVFFIAARMVDVTDLMPEEADHECVMLKRKIPEKPVLRAVFVLEAYHLRVIPKGTCLGAAPTLAWLHPQELQGYGPVRSCCLRQPPVPRAEHISPVGPLVQTKFPRWRRRPQRRMQNGLSTPQPRRLLLFRGLLLPRIWHGPRSYGVRQCRSLARYRPPQVSGQCMQVAAGSLLQDDGGIGRVANAQRCAHAPARRLRLFG